MKKNLFPVVISYLTILSSNTFAFFNEDTTIVGKIRGMYVNTSSKLDGLPKAISDNPVKVSPLFEMGMGVEVAADIFFSEHFALEAGTGLTLLRSKKTSLNELGNNYNSTFDKKKKDLYTIPTFVTFQYHLAPYGAIRPYVGAGYHYTFMQSKNSHYKISHANGFVAQAGVDFVFTDDSYMNFDIKYYNLETKLKFKKDYILGADGNMITSKMKVNPIYVGIGYGMKF